MSIVNANNNFRELRETDDEHEVQGQRKDVGHNLAEELDAANRDIQEKGTREEEKVLRIETDPRNIEETTKVKN